MISSQSSNAETIGKVFYTFEQMKTDLSGIVDQIEHSGWKPQLILGLTRGGLIPATMLSHQFSAPLIPINLSLRDFVRDQIAVISEIKTAFDQFGIEDLHNVLIVDDILDSGATLERLLQIFARTQMNNDKLQTRIAVLVHNQASTSDVKPHYVGTAINKDEDPSWLEFWFEGWYSKN